MTYIIKSIYKIEYRIGAAAGKFFSRHLFLSYFMAFIGMPVFILSTVFICTTILVLPAALLLGWL